MPPDGYTTVAIWNKTAAKLAKLVVSHDMGVSLKRLILYLMLPVSRKHYQKPS